MKTLTTNLQNQTAAEQSGWAELYDFYLKSALTTPFGVTSIIRIVQCPGDVSCFTPTFSPEPPGTQGTPATYLAWNIRRKSFKSSSKDANDKVAIVASNITGEWADMLAAVDWYDVPVVVRKISLTLAGTPTAQDCVTVFSGKIDSAKVTLEQIQFGCSNNFGTFGVTLPREDMHTNCRARWADDLCTAVRFRAENYKVKTVAAGTTVNRIASTGLTEDTSQPLPINPWNGYALDLDGTDAHVQINNYGGIMPAGEATIEWWQCVAESRIQSTVLLTADNPANRVNVHSPFSDGKVYFDYGDIFNGGRLSYTPPVSLSGGWHHFACVVSPGGNFMRIYRNGELEASKTGTSAYVPGTRDLLLGRYDAANTYKGALQEVRIWNHARTQAQIKAMLYRRATGAESGLVGCWHLDAGTGTVAADNSPSAKPGTLINDAKWLSAYGTDLVHGMADSAISSSSDRDDHEDYRVRTFHADDAYWRFAVMGDNPNADIDVYTPYVQFEFATAQIIRRLTVVNGGPTDPTASKMRDFEVSVSNDLTAWTSVGNFKGAAPTSYGHGRDVPSNYDPVTRSYTLNLSAAAPSKYLRVVIKLSDGSPFLTDVCGDIKAFINTDYTTDYVNGSTVSASRQITGFEAIKVKSGVAGTWRVNDLANPSELQPEDFNKSDWGNNYQGYWQIPDSQAGLANHKLTPYIQFDFGAAVTAKLWRFRARAGVERQDIPRLLVLFSSSEEDFSSDVIHETYFEMPPRGGQYFDCLMPNASSRRYWRVCVRSTWAESLNYVLFNKVQAYVGSRNYWAGGFITFAPSTATVALRGLSRPVLSSFNGVLYCSDLPVAPAAGDTFVVERGCTRLFNACCERRNWENFAGFTTLPNETVVR